MTRNLFRDILRDTNSRKYSMTKVAAFTSLLLLTVAVCAGIWIMIIEKQIDHILIGELIALLLTLLGFKNFKDNFKSYESFKSKEISELNDIITEKENSDDIG